MTERRAPKPPLWTPPGDRTRASGMARFAAWAAERGLGRGHGLECVAEGLAGGGGGGPEPGGGCSGGSAPRAGGPRAAGHRGGGPAPNSPRRAYDRLWRWSVDDQAAFWSALWDWSGVVGDKGERVLADGDRMPGARYFPDARLNFAENLLRPGVVRRRAREPAIIASGETGARRTVTWQELHDLVSRLQQAMRHAGLGPGDRVAALLPNAPEAVAVMLAAASLGAVISTASPDFGVQGVVDRFAQVRPRLLFVVEGYAYGGKHYDVLARVPAMLEGLPTVERVVVVPGGGAPAIDGAGGNQMHGDGPAPSPRPNDGAAGLGASHPLPPELGDAVSFAGFVRPFQPGAIDFARLPFDHPLYILFSSGTTGVPKCIVHRAGGVLLQHVKEHRLHCDVRPGDRVFYYTTLGWMMWNWLVSALASEAAILLWDGSPVHPGQGALFDFADAVGMTLMGASPGYLGALRKSDFRPAESHDLSALRTLLCTGSPVPPAAFEYGYRSVKRDMLVASISGGTDLCACLVGTVPGLPVRAGEIQAPVLGMAVDVFGPGGKSAATTRPGELVCTAPFPSLPLGFLNDKDGSRYHNAYFARFPGVWRHGDWIERTEAGGYVIHGRSDATLNVHGVRIGTAEIYRPVERMAEVAEAVAVEQRWGEGARMVLFVRLRDGAGVSAAEPELHSEPGAQRELDSGPAPGPKLDDALRERIRHVLRTEASPRHVPAEIVQVQDIPRTRSGKVVELAVRAVVHGEPVANVEALANAEALEQFRGRV